MKILSWILLALVAAFAIYNMVLFFKDLKQKKKRKNNKKEE